MLFFCVVLFDAIVVFSQPAPSQPEESVPHIEQKTLPRGTSAPSIKSSVAPQVLPYQSLPPTPKGSKPADIIPPQPTIPAPQLAASIPDVEPRLQVPSYLHS